MSQYIVLSNLGHYNSIKIIVVRKESLATVKILLNI